MNETLRQRNKTKPYTGHARSLSVNSNRMFHEKERKWPAPFTRRHVNLLPFLLAVPLGYSHARQLPRTRSQPLTLACLKILTLRINGSSIGQRCGSIHRRPRRERMFTSTRSHAQTHTHATEAAKFRPPPPASRDNPSPPRQNGSEHNNAASARCRPTGSHELHSSRGCVPSFLPTHASTHAPV